MRAISIRAFACAFHVAAWFVVVATVCAELFPAFKTLLADGFGHHWLAKSDIAAILFIATALVCARREDPEDVVGIVKGVVFSAAVGGLVIFLFYLAHYRGLL